MCNDLGAGALPVDSEAGHHRLTAGLIPRGAQAHSTAGAVCQQAVVLENEGIDKLRC